MSNPPSGEVTFLFTDVEGSTALWEREPDAMRVALEQHDATIRAAVEANAGVVFSTAGDGFGAVFPTASDALAAAIAAQLGLIEPEGAVTLNVRMALHTGTASQRDDNYFGAAVNRCARLMSAAHGRQILTSQATAQALVGALPDGTELVALGVHRLKDLVEPEQVHQVRHPDLEPNFPKILTLEGPGDGLPTQLTSFVGRVREMGQVLEALATHRLVTLTGSGGAGKTRLALQAAADAAHDYPDGVRLVELAAITDGDVFIDEVANRLGTQAHHDVAPVDAIAASIGRRRMLLVLDNCEQIVAAVAALGQHLLATCPHLTILATSRELLGIDGEMLYQVPSLDLPRPGVELADSLECDAVRLFVERARLSSPSFEVTPANVGDVIAICRRLDGFPLALELAAARIRAMSPGQIATRLDQRFELLTSSGRVRSERQQTLLGAITWSYDLLSEHERITFHRLSSFVSHFSLDAAEHVCAGHPIHDPDVADFVSALVDKSMVATVEGYDGSTRYVLLESIRVFGTGHLEATPERDVVVLRQVEWYTRFAESIQERQRNGDLADALERLDEESDNLRMSLRFAIGSGHLLLAGRLVAALGYLWYAAGLHREGIQWCRDVFERAPELPDEIRAGVLHSYGTLLGSWTSPDLGVTLLAEEVELRRRLGDPVRLAAALNNLGNLRYDLGQPDMAQRDIREAIEVFRRAGTTPTLALSSLAGGHLHTGEIERAAELYAEALHEADAVHDAYGMALAASGLGQCAVRSGRATEARPFLVRARAGFEELKVTPGVADADFNLALVARAEGSRVDAAAHLLSSLATPGAHWYDDAQYWLVQVAASIVDEPETAGVLVGAATSRYDGRSVAQPAFVLADLATTRRMLEERIGRSEVDHWCQRGRWALPVRDRRTGNSRADETGRVRRSIHSPGRFRESVTSSWSRGVS